MVCYFTELHILGGNNVRQTDRLYDSNCRTSLHCMANKTAGILLTGSKGAMGLPGLPGQKGSPGRTAAAGPKGETGEPGRSGRSGDKGRDGMYTSMHFSTGVIFDGYRGYAYTQFSRSLTFSDDKNKCKASTIDLF